MSGAFKTQELRWFFDGHCPQAVKQWYYDLARLPGDFEAPERLDVYLLLDGRDDVGLKLRKNKLQLKTRDYQEAFTSGQISGLREVWRRHSWKLAGETPDALSRLFLAGPSKGRRVGLAKRRLQATFTLASEKDLQPEPRPRRAPGFITIEVAEIGPVEISRAEQGCWSLCFETVPQEASASAFDSMINRLLAHYPGPVLSEDNSYGYPRYLRKIGPPPITAAE